MEEKIVSTKKIVIIIAASVAGVLLIGLAAIAAVMMLRVKPEVRVANALQNFVEESEAYENPLLEEVGFDQIFNVHREDGLSMDVQMKITPQKLLTDEIPDLAIVSAMGINLWYGYDYQNKAMNMDIGVDYSNVELFQFQMAANEDEVFVELPDLLSSPLKMPAIGFSEAYNRSELSTMLEMTLEEELDLDFFVEYEESNEEGPYSKEFIEAIDVKTEELLSSVVIMESDTAIEMEIDGKMRTCDGFEVTFSVAELNDIFDLAQEEIINGPYGQAMREQMNITYSYLTDEDREEMWQSVIEIFDTRITDDVTLILYLDNHDRIVHVTTRENIIFSHVDSDLEIGFKIDYKGEERAQDSMYGILDIMIDEVVITTDFVVDREVNDEKHVQNMGLDIFIQDGEWEEENINVSYNNEWDLTDKSIDWEFTIESDDLSVTTEMTAEITDIVQNESCTINIGSFKLGSSYGDILKLNGSIKAEPLSQELDMPRNALDLFDLSEYELMTLMYELSSSLYNL